MCSPIPTSDRWYRDLTITSSGEWRFSRHGSWEASLWKHRYLDTISRWQSRKIERKNKTANASKCGQPRWWACNYEWIKIALLLSIFCTLLWPLRQSRERGPQTDTDKRKIEARRVAQILDFVDLRGILEDDWVFSEGQTWRSVDSTVGPWTHVLFLL